MSNKGYAYAVANVRAMETELFSPSFFEQLISAPSVEALLSDKGMDGNTMQKVWDYLTEIAPEKEKFEFLIVKNDFQNLKTVIKSIVADAEPLFVKPCIVEADELLNAVKNKDFEVLPEWLADTAKNAYEILTSTMDGQLFEMYVDKKSMETTLKFAMHTDIDFAVDITEEFIALTNIKIALRLSGSTKSESLWEYAFCECKNINIKGLRDAAQKGDVISYLADTKYAYLAEYYQKSIAEFERECDNRIMRMLEGTKYISLSAEPLIAYYYAKNAENRAIEIIKNIRGAGLSAEYARERMRELYV